MTTHGAGYPTALNRSAGPFHECKMGLDLRFAAFTVKAVLKILHSTAIPDLLQCTEVGALNEAGL